MGGNKEPVEMFELREEPGLLLDPGLEIRDRRPLDPEAVDERSGSLPDKIQ
jgi:hypothetical protein